MKAPVGLLSDGTVCVSRWRGFAPTSSVQVSVEDKIRNHRLTDISHNMISGGHECEVRCKSLSFQHGHWLRGASAPGWEKNIHRLHRGRGYAGHYRFFELVMSGIFWCCPINFNGIFILLQFSLRLLYLFHANLYAHG